MTNYPITPPPELVEQWADKAGKGWRGNGTYEQDIATQAARWGADQQLELDARWLDQNALNETHLKITPIGDVLKEAMRPKPLSLKEQALDELDLIPTHDNEGRTLGADVSIIRRALEALPND